MKRAYFICLFQCLTGILLFSQSNPAAPIRQGSRVISQTHTSHADPRADIGILDSYAKRLSRFAERSPGVKGLPTAASSIFEIASTHDSGGEQPMSVAVGDLNGDGKPDLVVANMSAINSYPNGEVSVLLGRGDGTFRTAATYASGGNEALSVALADLNGDGKLDLVVANGCDSSGSCENGAVGILLGNGDGTFRAPITYSSGGYLADSVVVKDVNGDGKPDIVVADLTDSTGSTGLVSVLLGNGDGTFRAAVAYGSGGINADSVAIGDLNGDGKADLVVAQCDVHNQFICIGTIGVLLGNGDGTFQAAVTCNSGGIGASSVAIGDVNGDGKLDLLVANLYVNDSGDGAVGVLLGNGDGSFQTAVLYDSGGSEAQSVALADVNGDGKPDLLVANCGGSSEACDDGNNAAVGILLGNGDGTFRPAVTYASGGLNASSVALSDVDGDGKPDLLVANRFPCTGCSYYAVGVLLGNGDGTFRAASIYGSGGSHTFSVAAGDINGDGNSDLAMALTCSDQGTCIDSAVGVLLGNGDGTFQTAVAYDSGGYDARSAVLADVRGDGKFDLIVANECAAQSNCNGAVGVLLGNGDGTFQAAATYGSGGYYANSIQVADVNGDGNPDLLVVNECSDDTCTSGNVGVLLGNGDGTFRSPVTYGSGGYYADSLAVADVNRDGNLDLLVANQCAIDSNCASSGGLAVLLGNGDGTFRPAIAYDPGGQYPWSLAVGDVNGDGKPDLVVANQCDRSGACANGSLGVLLGNGDGTFQAASSTTIPAYGFGSIVLADFNGDGKLDIASGGAILLLGNGDGTFQNFMVLGAGGFGIAVGDFNRDGKPDLAVGNVAVLLNIAGAPTSTALVSSPNPSRSDQRVTFTATVSSSRAAPAGKVTFMNGAAVLARRTLIGGTASFATTNLPAGLNRVTAVYAGNSNFRGSASAPVNQFVLAATTTTLSSSLSPSAYGQMVTFSAVVASSQAAPPDGETVTFMHCDKVLGSGILWRGSADFTTSTINVGTTAVKAVYAGDSNLAGSTSKVVSQVVGKATTTLALTSSQNPSGVGQAVTFAVNVTPSFSGTVTGAVTFYDGTTKLKTESLSGGYAEFTTSKLMSGAHIVTATYSGNASFGGSSASLTQTVR